MTRWENTSVYRALGTLSALPVRALSRLPLKAGKRRCGLSFSQWFLLLGMGAMLCVPHGAWNNLYAVLFALAALLVYWFGCAARKDTPRNIGDLGPAALGFLLMTVLCTLWAGNKAGNLRVALFFWTGFLLAYLTAAQFRTRTDRRTAAAALYITLLAVSLYGLWNYVTGAEASDVPIDGEMYPAARRDARARHQLRRISRHGAAHRARLGADCPDEGTAHRAHRSASSPLRGHSAHIRPHRLDHGSRSRSCCCSGTKRRFCCFRRRRSASALCFFCRRACRRGSYRCSISRTLRRPDGLCSGASVWPCGRITGCSASGWGRRISPRLTPPMLPVFSIFSRRTPICCILKYSSRPA